MQKYSENVENNGFYFKKDLTNDYANAYNVIRRIEESGEGTEMTNTERRIEELKREIENLRRELKDSKVNRSTLHNVKFNTQRQARRYDMSLELSDKEDELEELENLNLREVS